MPAIEPDLLAAAREARQHAYAPYSGFPVGAALLTANGEVVCGVNVENASYPLALCAERCALAAAVARGCRKFVALAIVGPEGAEISPCGGCRQALAEFGTDLRIVREGRPAITLAALLPDPFGPGHLHEKETAG